MNTPPYPQWICLPCGWKIGTPGGLCTVHEGDPDDPTDACGWCGSKERLTEPRDFGYPPIGK